MSAALKKSEKGIKILAPAPFKMKKEMERIDPQTQRPVTGGKERYEHGTFTVEETNLICIYIADTHTELIEKVIGALPFMDEEMRTLADRTLDKLRTMSDAEFAVQSFDFTDY